MPRFVVLEHDYPTRHWDLLLECGAVLRAWRLVAPPTRNGPVAAERSFDHRLVYLTYEGPVSGSRGTVARWDSGTYETLAEADEDLSIRIRGNKLRGCCRIGRGASAEWQLWFAPEDGG